MMHRIPSWVVFIVVVWENLDEYHYQNVNIDSSIDSRFKISIP